MASASGECEWQVDGDVPVLLRLTSVSRSFPGVVALDGVSFDVRGGEVHALVGENGAGKSTLINIISGVLRPDSGEIALEGNPIQLSDPVMARRRGIVSVHQEAELFGTLSVAENMALLQGLPTRGWGLVDWGAVERAASAAVAAVGDAIDVRQAAARLSVAHRHMTQVAAAVLHQAKVVVLDEPTSALTLLEVEWLFEQIRRLKAAGAGIIYVSHRQDEIFQLADRITVLRDGRRVWSGVKSEIDRPSLIEQMVGRERACAASDPDPAAVRGKQAVTAAREPGAPGPPRLRVQGLTGSRHRFRDVGFSVHCGEILGIYGLIGSGRTELARAVFGLDACDEGTIEVDGRRCVIRRPSDAVAAGIAYLPEDRLREGLCRGLSVRANTVLATLSRWKMNMLTSVSAERAATTDVARQLAIRCRSPEQVVGELSGGNQQKVVLGRWMLTAPKVLILDEPTRGVDVASKAEIHRLLGELAAGGCALVLISSELPEVMEHSDRVLVFRDGSVAGEIDPRQARPSDVASAALPDRLPDRRARSAVVASAWLSRLPRGEFGLCVVVAALAAWLAASSEGFSVLNLLATSSLWMILGLAAACVIIPGGIDISLGSLVGLSAAVAALVLNLPWPPWVTIPLGIAAGLAVGAAGGLLNAALSLAGRVHPIVVTLGTMTIYRGLVIALLGSRSVTGLPRAFGRLAFDAETGFRGGLLIATAIVAVCYIWLAQTPSGRHLYALGSGPSAARLAGISRARVWLLAFGVAGLLAGLAGVLQLSQSGQLQSRLGTDWELSAIAVAVIGGVAIQGGRGSVVGVVLGAVLLRLVNSALVRWGISQQQVELLVGGMILAAVLLDLSWRGKQE